MRTCISLENHCGEPLPADIPGPDVRYPEELVRQFVEELTRPGDVVFDPFAGYGTTLKVAEAMGRDAWGVEINPERLEYALGRLTRPERLLAGDVRQLSRLPVPPIDLCMTSPPYMHRDDPEDPLSDEQAPEKGYEQYLDEIGQIYEQIGRLMKPGARAVIEVSNLKRNGRVTTLAWDIARTVSRSLRFEGEVVAAWNETYGYGYDHSYCLVFGGPL
ncbi:MAG: hypothetical protein LC772_07970 [Chloroflexi bacterium]|nr:hypothetical protein [Chloroflexota bacterium]